MGKIQIGAAINASFRFVGEAWTRSWGVMLALVWFTAMLAVIQLIRPEWGGGVTPLGTVFTLFLSTAATGALYRLRLTESHPGDGAFVPGPAGFKWGALEWRVMGANVLVGLVIGVVLVIAVIVWAIAFGITASTTGAADVQLLEGDDQSAKMEAFYRLLLGPSGVVTALIGIPMALGLFWLSAKLALVAPQAADTGRFNFGTAWALTRGAVLPLIVASIVIFFMQVVISAVLGGVAGFFAGLTGHVGQGSAWGGVLGETISAAINIPLFAGLVLYVYRTQRGDPGVAATFS
jgi:hypothetical protein